MHLTHAIDDFLVARADLSPHTQRDYRYYLETWRDWAGDPDLQAVTRHDVLRFFAYMANDYRTKHGGPLSQSGLYNCWCALRSFYAWAADVYAVDNHALALRRPQKAQAAIHALSRDEIQRLLSAIYTVTVTESRRQRSYARNRQEADRDAALLLLFLDTGIRVGEMSRLTVADVNLARREIEVRPHRSGRKSRARTIPFSRDTLTLLLRWYAARCESGEPLDADGRPFPDAGAFVTLRTHPGHPMTPRNIRGVLSAAGARAGIDVHPHLLRHTFATQYLRNGGDPFTLQTLLGHATMEMVRHYVHFVQADIRGNHESASPVARMRLRLPR